MKTKSTFKQAFIAGLSAAGVAAVINVILFFVFSAAGLITDDIFIQPNQPMTAVPVIISSVVPTLLASVVFFLIDKYTSNGYKVFTIMALVLLVLSFANPFLGIQGVSLPYALSLDFMHIVVVGSLLFFLKNINKA